MMSMLGFEFNGAMVGWIVTAVLGLFVVFGLLWGLIRGFQKTVFRGLWLILVAFILLLLTPIITKWIMSIDLSKFNWQISGEPVTSVDGVLESVITNIDGMENATQNNPILLEFVKKAPLLLLNSLVFVILFWLFKIVLWPIWAIFAKLFFKKYKTVEGIKGKNMPKEKRVKVKKHRALGMLVGVVCGLFVGALTLMPVNGLLDVVEKLNGANTAFVTGQKSEEGIVDYYLGDNAEYVTGAANNVGSKVLKYTGLGWLNDTIFDELCTIKIDDQKIALNEEVDGVVKVLNAIGEVRCADFDNLTQPELKKVIENSRIVVNYLFELKMFTIVGGELVPYLANEIATTGKINTGVAQGDKIVDDALLEVAKINMDYLKGEFNAILNVLQVANDADVFLPMLNKNIPFNEFLDRCNSEFVDDFVEALFSSKIFTATSVSVINNGIDFAMEKLEAEGFTENSELTVQTVKAQFKNLLNNTIALSRHVDFGDTINVEKNALAPMGALLEDMKALVTTSTFDALIDKVSEKASESLDETIKSPVLEALSNLKTLTDFESEFGLYENLWDDIMTLTEADFSDFGSVDMAKAGSVLDGLKDSQVFGPVIDNLVVDLLNKAKTNISSGLTGDENAEMRDALTDSFDIMIWNINDETYERADNFWETEMTALQGLLDLDLSTVNADKIEEIGATLDQARTSVLLTRAVDEDENILDGKDALNVLLDTMFDKAINSIVTGKPTLSAILEEVKENLITLPTTVTYESEFAYLADFMDQFDGFDASTLTPGTTAFNTTIIGFGTTLDGVNTSRLFVNTDNVSCPDVRQDLVSYLLTEMKNSMDIQFTKDLLTSMDSHVKYITSYTDEFTHIANLTGILDSFTGAGMTPGTETFNTTMTDFGAKLDSLRTSKLFIHEDNPDDTADVEKDLRKDVLEYVVKELKGKMSSSLSEGIDASALIGDTNSLAAGMLSGINFMPLPSEEIAGQTPYADEMTHLTNLINALYNITDYEALLNNSTTLNSLGDTLDKMKQGYTVGTGTETKQYTTSTLCGDAGYYIIKMFVDAIGSLDNLTNTITVYATRTAIVDAFVANAEKVNPIHYNKTTSSYTIALNSFASIKNIFVDVATNIQGDVKAETFSVDTFAGIFNDLQAEMMADWNVTSLLVDFALDKMEISAEATYDAAVAAANLIPNETAKTNAINAAKTRAAILINEIRKMSVIVRYETSDILVTTNRVGLTETVDTSSFTGNTPADAIINNYQATGTYTSTSTGGYAGLLNTIKTVATS